MRCRAALLTLVAAIGLGWPAAAGAGAPLDLLLPGVGATPLTGRLAHPFALPRLDGGRFTLADLSGRAALLYFWATW